MAGTLKIIRFRYSGELGKVHIGLQDERSRIVYTLCRGEVEGKPGEVVLSWAQKEECSLCRMKKWSLEKEFGALKKWGESQGYAISGDFTE